MNFVGVRFIASVWGLWGGRDKSRPYSNLSIYKDTDVETLTPTLSQRERGR